MNFDQRKRLILNALLKGRGYLTSGQLSELSGVTSRTVRNDIKAITDELNRIELPIEASPGRGYRIPEDARPEIHRRLDVRGEIPPVSPDERMFYIINCLIFSPSVRIADILTRIHISESTWEKDLERCSTWFYGFNIDMMRNGDDLWLEGTEEQLRQIHIPYYNELSHLGGVGIDVLLKNDFSEYERTKKRIDRYLLDIELTLSDNDYTGVLIYLLASNVGIEEGGLCPAFEERLNAILQNALKNEERIIRIKELAAIVLKRLNQPPADEELIECISRVLSPVFHSTMFSYSEVSLQELEKQYPEALSLAICFIEDFGEDAEPVKIGMCFAAFLERSIFLRRKRVVVICSTGFGSVQLLSAKLSRMFPNLVILGVYTAYRLREAEAVRPDFIISTVDLDTDCDVVKISSFLNHNDFDRIMPLLRKNVRGRSLFLNILSKDLFFTDIELKTPDEVIRHLCRSAFRSEGDEFEHRVMEREALGSTAIGNLTAIPHAVLGKMAENRICIGILKKPIRWGKENVQIIFLLRLDDPDIDMAAVFEYIYSLVSNRQHMRRIIAEQDFSLLSGICEGLK
ncbi:MAG: PTS sugar transporter subunit IIA [Spirochaetales bacterium]|nr:PTS sugar transporter subunit IIA [Spirochaetales bacterium]